MTPTTLKARILRLEVRRSAGRFAGLSRDDLEREMFIRLRRMAAREGGIDGLLAHWDAVTDPQVLALTAKVRPYVLGVRDHFAEMEARLCTQH